VGDFVHVMSQRGNGARGVQFISASAPILGLEWVNGLYVGVIAMLGDLEHVPPELNRQDSHGVLDRRFYRH
jgi:hypothetical protein